MLESSVNRWGWGNIPGSEICPADPDGHKFSNKLGLCDSSMWRTSKPVGLKLVYKPRRKPSAAAAERPCWACSFSSHTFLIKGSTWLTPDTIDIPQSKQVSVDSSSVWQHRGANSLLLIEGMRWGNGNLRLSVMDMILWDDLRECFSVLYTKLPVLHIIL